MIGATRRDVDVLALTRSDFPAHYFRHFRGYRWIREQYRTYVQGKKHASSRGFCTRLRRTEDREFLIRLSRLGAVRILPDALFEKSWSMDGLSNQWASAGYELVSGRNIQGDIEKSDSIWQPKLLLCIYAMATVQASLAMLGDFIRSHRQGGCAPLPQPPSSEKISA
jgi:hypothetical protein